MIKEEVKVLEMEEIENVEALGDGAFWAGVGIGTAIGVGVGAIILT